MTSPDRIAAQLGGSAAIRAWLERLPTDEADPAPEGMQLVDVLGDLAVPHGVIERAVRLRPRLTDDSDLARLQRVLTAVLVADRGSTGPVPEFVDLGDGSDPLVDHFWLYVFAAAYGPIRAWHAERGIEEAVGRRTLADLGRQVTHNWRRRGRSGLNADADWLVRHFTGRIYQLGRLQFEIAPLGTTTGAEVRTAGLPYGPGDLALSVHIPDYCGPFPDALCQESLDLAAAFFARHFPDLRLGVATCHSWLLDPQLAHYLPPTSNILSFQRSFTMSRRPDQPADDVAFVFVFGCVRPNDLSTLPQDTRLQRALVDHVRSGGKWHTGHGWRPLRDRSDL